MNWLDFFKPVANDQSIAYLGALFGGLATLPGNPGILAALFKVFNTIILVVGLFVIVYTVIVGLLTTAHEGEFLAKKFHGLWTPLRMVIGIVALIPTPLGYSGLQVVLMWVFIQGIGAADNIWNTTLDFVDKYGFYGSMTDKSTTIEGRASEQMKKLFQALTCAASVNLAKDTLSADAKVDWAFKNFTGYAGAISNGKLQPATLKKTCFNDTCMLYILTSQNIYCGALSYANPNMVADDDTKKINKAQQDILIGSGSEIGNEAKIELVANPAPKSIIEQLYYLASFFATSDRDYINFYYTSPSYPENLDKDNNRVVKEMGIDSLNQYKDWAWVSDFCTSKGIVPCCREGKNCSNVQNKSELYEPTATGTTSSPNNPSNANLKAVEEIYFPYNIKKNALSQSAFANMSIGQKKLSDFKPDELSMSGFYNAVIDNLSRSYTTAIQDAMPAPKEGFVDDKLKPASNLGWLSAGAYYYYISTRTKQTTKRVNPKFDVILSTELNDYRHNMATAASLFTPPGGDPLTSQYAAVSGALQKTSLRLFMSNVTTGKVSGGDELNTSVNVNPLVKIQSYGQQLLLTVEVMYPIVFGVNTAFAVMSMITSTTFLGSGFAQGAYPILSAINSYITPMFLALFAILASIGGLLAVYLPLVPYIIFTVTALGWFISIVEAMVAAPLIAIGILSPSAQHHEILGKADQSLMTVFGIFLKPTLMVFGLIVAMLLASVAVSLVNMTFEQVVYSIIQEQEYAGGENKQTHMGMLELIFFMGAYLFLIVAVLNKCFTVIAILPGKVMAYIGGQADAGDLEALGEVKGAVGGAAGRVGGGAAQGIEGGRAAGKEKARAKQQVKDKTNAEAKTIPEKKAPEGETTEGETTEGETPGGGSGVGTEGENVDKKEE